MGAPDDDDPPPPYRPPSRRDGRRSFSSDDLSLTDTDSTSSTRSSRSRSRSRGRRADRFAVVRRDPYQIQAPPRAQLRRYESPSGDSTDEEEVRGNNYGERPQRRRPEPGLLVAVVVLVASLFFCLEECAE